VNADKSILLVINNSIEDDTVTYGDNNHVIKAKTKNTSIRTLGV